MNKSKVDSYKITELQEKKLNAEIDLINKQLSEKNYKLATILGSFIASAIALSILFFGFYNDTQQKYRKNELFEIEYRKDSVQKILEKIQRRKDSLNLAIIDKDYAINLLTVTLDSLNNEKIKLNLKLDFAGIEVELRKLRQIADSQTNIETLNFLISELKKETQTSIVLEDSIRNKYVGNRNYKLNLLGYLILYLSDESEYNKNKFIEEIEKSLLYFRNSEKEFDEELFRILLLYHKKWDEHDYINILSSIDNLTKQEFKNYNNQIHILRIVSDIYYMNRRLVAKNVDLYLNFLETELNIITGNYITTIDSRRMLINLSPQGYASLFLKKMYNSMLFRENYYTLLNNKDSLGQPLDPNFTNNIVDSYIAIELGTFVNREDSISEIGKILHKYYQDRSKFKEMIKMDIGKFNRWLEENHTYFRENPNELITAIKNNEL